MFFTTLPKKSPDILYIGLNDRDKAWHDLYKLSISTGEKTLLRKNTDRITGWVFDLSGHLRLATRSAENGDTEILRVDADKFTKIYSCNVFESCGPLQFQPGNQRVYIETNKDANLISLALLDPQTGKTEMVESDPLGKVDFGGALFSEKTDELVETWYIAARAKTYYKEKAFGDDVHWIERKFNYPEKEVSVVSRTARRKPLAGNRRQRHRTRPDATFSFARRTRSHRNTGFGKNCPANTWRRSSRFLTSPPTAWKFRRTSRLPKGVPRKESADVDDSPRRAMGTR